MQGQTIDLPPHAVPWLVCSGLPANFGQWAAYFFYVYEQILLHFIASPFLFSAVKSRHTNSLTMQFKLYFEQTESF